LTVYDDLGEARESWSAALEHCAATGFQSVQWCDAFQRTIGQAEGVRPVVVVLADAARRTLLLWPLGIYTEGGLKVLRFLGGVVTDYHAPLTDPAFAATVDTSLMDALWESVLKAVPPVDLVWLRRMPAVIDEVPNVMTRLTGSRHTENAYAATLPTSAAAFRATRAPKLFADARRQLRRLGEIAPVTIVERASPEQAHALTAVMAGQKSRRWHESQGRDLFAEAGYLAFYQELASGAQAWDAVAVCALQVGDTPVATHWGMIFRGRYYWLMPGYEAGTWARYSSGRVLMQHMIEWSIAEGLSVFDLTVGDEDYKKAWADHSLDLHEWVAPRTLKGRAPVLKRRAREWARSQPWLKAAVQRIRGRR